MSDFSEKLKSARIFSGYSIKEATVKLISAGIKISEKTLYNWESGTRTPDADDFMIICDVYGIKSFEQFDGLTDEQSKKETELLFKYRALGADGRARVDNNIRL